MNNRLEEILTQAASPADAERLGFNQELCVADLLVLLRKAEPKDLLIVAVDDEVKYTPAISMQGSPRWPVFTSEVKLDNFLKQVTGWEPMVRKIKGRDVLSFALHGKDLVVVLNPMDQYGVQLVPKHMQAILS